MTRLVLLTLALAVKLHDPTLETTGRRYTIVSNTIARQSAAEVQSFPDADV